MKLPKLTIQPFKGELTAWTTFWDAYEVAIHSNRSLSDIERFNYLRSLLQGPALDAITGLTLTAANYREAVEVLSKRFGNKQRIIDKHMEALLSLDAVPSDTNLKALRHLYDAIESQVRGLKSMGVTPETYGSLLSSVVVAKIPPEIRLIISRKIGDGDRKLDDLMAILLDEVQARERAAASDVSPVKSREGSGRHHSTAAALLASTGGGPLACYYCQQPHLASACKSVTSVEERKRILREAGRCFVCLRRGHVVRQCTSRGRCSHCRGRHHGSICGNQKPAEGEAKPPDSREGAPVKTNSSGTNPAAAPFKPDTSTTLWTNSSQAVLLQTAKAAGFNPANPKRSGHVRVVFDTGSQRSYVTEHVARNLSLVEEGEQPLTILTFGSNREQTRVCKFVTMGLASRDGMTKQLRLFVVPTICEPIACQPISFCQSDFSHLAGIDLADASDGNESMKVDILIGSDQYWELVTGETRRGDTGPVAIRTMFGWVLSGPTSRHVADAAAACLVTHTLRVDGLSRESQVLDDRLRSFWDLESFGIIDATNAVHDEFTTTVQQVEGRYEVQLPWREGHPVLHDNHQLSLKRLHGLMKRLKQDPAILHEYDATIKSQMQQGIVEIVKCTDEPPERVHYLPHHAVVRRNKETTKVRVVYDASARADGPSLNECLHVGPLYVKGEAGMKKVWICLYTCCVVRAVHLDLVSDQTTPAFLRCFKRFVARRGLPLQMVSDNGKTFKAAEKALRDVKWVFNVPKAPWWGGVFERMVRCVKRCLRKMVGQAKLSEDELLTSLVEVEAVLNSRPLTVVSAEDLEEPLTPSHLIVGRRLLSSATTAPCPEPDEFQPGTVDDLTRRSRYLNAALDHFWRRWSKEYLIGLREMHSHYKNSSRTPRVAVGDVVIIHSDDQPRGMWRLGKVEELLTGPDGEHRAAVLRVAGQGRSAKRLRRPVQRLYPLECSVPKTQSPNPSESSASAGEDASDERLPVAELPRERDPPVRRSERVASQVARDRLLAHALESGAESDEC